ncbi:MAG: helix-turn-helix domain-containing protein [Alphaproteobacteria bacterium]|nr:helix-turn-helix domain-containing protein [Alphaproteobacteria bacterium]
MIDAETAHAAVESRDKRFDGAFFTGVTSTGIYCRCVCSARAPKRENRRFYASAAAAEKAGFRPCLLCRPECAPGLAPIDAAERLAHDACKLIEAGALEEQGLGDLAGRLGVSDRHLRRAMLKTFGASPMDIAQTHRLLTAKRLLADTGLGMAEIAFASGFQSVRRFNALFQERYGLTPSRVRGRGAKISDAALRLTLEPRGAFSGAAPFEHLARRRVARLEAATAPMVWARSLQVGAHAGWIELDLRGPAPRLALSETLYPALRPIVAAVRGALDLDAATTVIDAGLARDPFWAGDVAAEPGVRLPGGVDPFEIAVRAVLGQQITVVAATTLAGRLTERFGAAIETPIEGVDRLFPSPARIADAGIDALAALGQPRKRAETLWRLAKAVADGELKLSRGAIAAGRAGLASIPGIGPWTVEYVALRGLGDPDAFPVTDSALRAAFGSGLEAAHETWRPWRGYAAARLWRRHAAQIQERGAR